MKSTLFFLFLIIGGISFAQDQLVVALNGSNPGSTAEIFAPDIVSVEGRYEFGITFSQKGDEIIFTGQTGREGAPILYHMKYADGNWANPKALNITADPVDGEMEAHFFNKGNKLFFVCTDSIRCEIWSADIVNNDFVNARKLDSPLNEKMVFYPTLTHNGKLFYTDIMHRKIESAESENNKFTKLIDPQIPFGGHAFIAPDESFAVVDWKGDIHITYKKEKWTEPVKLNEHVNSEFSESCPALSPDGKYLFFSRYNEPNEVSNIYWIELKNAIN